MPHFRLLGLKRWREESQWKSRTTNALCPCLRITFSNRIHRLSRRHWKSENIPTVTARHASLTGRRHRIFCATDLSLIKLNLVVRQSLSSSAFPTPHPRVKSRIFVTSRDNILAASFCSADSASRARKNRTFTTFNYLENIASSSKRRLFSLQIFD